jgi:hypothetical protein
LGESLKALGKDWFSGFTLADENLAQHIEKSISKAKAFAIEKQGGFRGCSIIVPCGYGKGLGMLVFFLNGLLFSDYIEQVDKFPDYFDRRYFRLA